MPALASSAISAPTFISGLGVDTHIPYTDGGYVNINNVIADLKYLGINQVRDGISDGARGSAPLSSYIAMAKAGIHFTVIVEASTSAKLAAELTLIDRLQTAVPGAVVAVEGPNEINNWPVTFDGVGGLQGALNLQSALYTAVHSDPTLAGVGVDYFTGYAAGGVPVGRDPVAAGGLADFDNQHPYPSWGQAPAPVVARSHALPNTSSPTEPAVYTETGYSTNEVSPNVQAKYTLDLLLDTARENISKTYLYQLMDAYQPGSPQGDDGFGLFDPSGAAKPAADAIHNLTTILQATSGVATSIPASLAYDVAGLPATGHTLAIAKADGSYDIVVWAEPKIWDPNAHQEIAAPDVGVTINLSQPVDGYTVYDPLKGAAAIASGGSTTTINVAVSDHPVIIEVHGGALSRIIGGPADDVLTGPDGQSNYIRGQDGNDSITGGTGFNNVNGNTGDDTIVGRSQVGDWLLGGQGNDLITARSGAHNLINGNLGDDTLAAGSGGDTLRGGQGADSLTGGAGADWLSGDRGHDTLTGGGGADTFHGGQGMGVSTVTDFNAAEGDRVQLDAGSTPTVTQAGADVVIDLGAGGKMILQHVDLTTLQNQPGWLFYA
jgi:Ca2+-binding RTX toxin-like protein